MTNPPLIEMYGQKHIKSAHAPNMALCGATGEGRVAGGVANCMDCRRIHASIEEVVGA